VRELRHHKAALLTRWLKEDESHIGIMLHLNVPEADGDFNLICQNKRRADCQEKLKKLRVKSRQVFYSSLAELRN